PPRLAHAPAAPAGSRRLGAILEADRHGLEGAVLEDRPLADVPRSLEHPAQLLLHPRARNVHRVVARVPRIADPGQHVGNRIGHDHLSTTLRPYQLALTTPGI